MAVTVLQPLHDISANMRHIIVLHQIWEEFYKQSRHEACIALHYIAVMQPLHDDLSNDKAYQAFPGNFRHYIYANMRYKKDIVLHQIDMRFPLITAPSGGSHTT